MAGFDVITVGRVSVDLYPEQIGVGLPEVTRFTKSLGGSPTNVAVACARLGTRATGQESEQEEGWREPAH